MYYLGAIGDADTHIQAQSFLATIHFGAEVIHIRDRPERRIDGTNYEVSTTNATITLQVS
jgi:hypothetical protein